MAYRNRVVGQQSGTVSGVLVSEAKIPLSLRQSRRKDDEDEDEKAESKFGK